MNCLEIASGRVAGLAVCLAMIGGCGKSKPPIKIVPATGTVTINSQPAGNILVQTLPDAARGTKGPTSTGITDERGRFVLTTPDGVQGAVVGPCHILLSDLTEERTPQGETPVAVVPRLSPRYSVIGPQGLSAVVSEDGTPITIEIND